jgi:hypothetical protein
VALRRPLELGARLRAEEGGAIVGALGPAGAFEAFEGRLVEVAVGLVLGGRGDAAANGEVAEDGGVGGLDEGRSDRLARSTVIYWRGPGDRCWGAGVSRICWGTMPEEREVA